MLQKQSVKSSGLFPSARGRCGVGSLACDSRVRGTLPPLGPPGTSHDSARVAPSAVLNGEIRGRLLERRRRGARTAHGARLLSLDGGSRPHPGRWVDRVPVYCVLFCFIHNFHTYCNVVSGYNNPEETLFQSRNSDHCKM